MNIKSIWHKISIGHLAIAFIVLNIADGALTKALINIGGSELSPIWSFFLDKTNVWEFVALKTLCALVICLCLYMFSFVYYDKVKRIATGLVIGMTIVFIINAINISAYFAGRILG